MHGVRLVATPAAKSSGTATSGRSRSVASMPSGSGRTGTLPRERRLRHGGSGRGDGIPARDVALQDGKELGDDALALERDHQTAIDVDRRLGLFERPGQGDADVRVLGLARPVYDAAH